ncbi:hypothetical protein ACOMICROBIO_LKFPLAJE_05171 (plasmid) [Vibrio sp. B1FIG11]|nr:hypothetical protein ACOMICROBIO_LKFPLAJE_05171 [Vibrio sp. B1FIG11]
MYYICNTHKVNIHTTPHTKMKVSSWSFGELQYLKGQQATVDMNLKFT